jgi:hypothetical protein
MKILIAMICLLFLLLNIAFAGDQKGNGGDSVDCGEKSYLLDFYLRPGTYVESSLNELEIVDKLLDKIAAFSPVRAELYRARLGKFMSQTTFVNGSLGTISDIGIDYPRLPEGCKIVQAALQKLIVFGNEKRYFISQEQWSKLSGLHRAGLILHELFYLELQAKDSFKLGRFNAYLFANFSNQLNKKEFYTTFKQTGFKWVYLFDIPMDVAALKITDSVVTSLSTYPDMPFKILNQEVSSVAQFIDSYPTGVPKQLTYRGELKYQSKGANYRICGAQVTNCKVSFNPDRSLSSLNQVEVTDLGSGKVETGMTIRFDKNGGVDVVR